ncbi:MAG: adenosylmethionine--8-amino-7-oxononanoate transaminase [Candidatus Hydrogenedentes bacterium]|nr:adenosylmethionine--8-amino-7-oxononanoate transaminase [Candidatus Hydrogenedentota bacterium]
MTDSLRELDLRHLWHPYTDANYFEQSPYTSFDRAEGVYLYRPDGTPVLDGIASWWAVALGHSHPAVIEAIREQAGILQHSILGNLSHPLAVRLAARLAEITPEGLNRAYFACDGASATESAMKMAIQYWANIGKPEKHRFVSLQDGYHGDTLGAVGVGFVPEFHRHFDKAVVHSYVADSPHCTCCPYEKEEDHCALTAFESMRSLVEEHHSEIAAVILEPLCQGAAGIRIYPAEYLRRARALCDEYDLILIADEIAVGFWRTGKLFACETAGIVPDILCLGKALTAGYLPMSVAITTDRIFEAFRSDDEHDRTFYDGHTFCGNPITAAAALAAIDIYAGPEIPENVLTLIPILKEGFAEIGEIRGVEYQKTLGMIGMCGFTRESGGSEFARKAARIAMERGLFIRPLGDVLYLWPPLVTTPEQLHEMLAHFRDAIGAASDQTT